MTLRSIDERDAAPAAAVAAARPGPGSGALVVLPTFQEATNVDTVLRRVRAALPNAEVLVVDDASPDGTADLAEDLAGELGGIEVLRRPAKAGLASAYCDGMRWAAGRGYEYVVAMDADLSHDPARLPVMLAFAGAGADLVIGSRYVPGGATTGWSPGRRALSRWGNRYARVVLALPVFDATSGYRVYRADALAKIDLERLSARGFGFQVEMTRCMARVPGHIVEVPITFHDRAAGHSKMSSGIALEAWALVTWWAVADRAPRRPERSWG